MKYTPVLLVLAAGGLFGWFAPGLSPEGAAPAAEVQPIAQPAESRILPVGGDVVLPRAADVHFYAEVVVDATSARMLVDTGASMIALTAEDADAIGVPWRSEQTEPVARGAGGIVHGVRIVLDLVQVGGLEARDVEAVVVPEGLAISLLGQSFLSLVARVEIDRQ